MEEKAYLEQMSEKYIVGVPPLFVNEKIVIDGEEDTAGENDAKQGANDSEFDKLEGQFEKDQNDKEQKEKEQKSAKFGDKEAEIQSHVQIQ